MLLALITLPLLVATTVRTNALSFSLKYDLSYTGVPFAGGAIVVANNFTNIGQLTIRVTGVSLASDFWSNGTRQVTSGFPLNLTTGMNKEVDTPILIPASASIGIHRVTSTASWQYSNSSGWFNANPAVTSINVNVSQTLGSLFSGFVTILLIGVGVAAAVVVVLVVFLVISQRRKSKPGATPPASPQPTSRLDPGVNIHEFLISIGGQFQLDADLLARPFNQY